MEKAGKEQFFDRLKTMREKSGLRQKDMADTLGITRAGYQMIENGNNGKKFSYLPEIAKALGCRIDDLFPEMDDVQPEAAAPAQQMDDVQPEAAAPAQQMDDVQPETAQETVPDDDDFDFGTWED